MTSARLVPARRLPAPEMAPHRRLAAPGTTLAVAAAGAGAMLGLGRGFLALPASAGPVVLRAPFSAPLASLGLTAPAEVAVPAAAAVAFAVAAGGAMAAVATAGRRRRASHRGARNVARKAGLIGEDLAVEQDAFVVMGLAHCFEQGEAGKLVDVFVLEPVSASTVEVIKNGAQTSYESYMGTNVGTILSQDFGKFPAELLCGHPPEEVRFAENLEFRTGCAARTWLRDHARDVVRLMAPDGEVQAGFNKSLEHKRVLNAVHEVKDSDNVKQDMSIDVYGRSEEDEKGDDDEDAAIKALYDA